VAVGDLHVEHGADFLGPLLDELLVALPPLFLQRVHGEADADGAGVRRILGCRRGLLRRLYTRRNKQNNQGESREAHWSSREGRRFTTGIERLVCRGTPEERRSPSTYLSIMLRSIRI